MVSFEICRKWVLATAAAGLVHNLFAWEGHAIAERLGLAAIAASPFMLARPPPTRFFGELQRVQPSLYAALRTADPCETVAIQHVDHWLWRMFLDDVGDLREALGLPACPFLTAGGAVVDPLPAAPRLVCGVSAWVADRQPYWPASVVLGGYWRIEHGGRTAMDESCMAGTSDRQPELVAVGVFIDRHAAARAAGAAVVYVGFGSMETLDGVIPDAVATRLVAAAAGAIRDRGDLAIVQLREGTAVHRAWLAVPNHNEFVLLLVGYCPHAMLFDSCDVIVHHGGSGTAGAALAAGKPMLICPFMFDQRFWGDLLKHKGVCPSIIPPETASRLAFRAGLSACGSAEVRRAAAELGKALRAEDGVGATVAIIAAEILAHRRRVAAPPAPLAKPT